MLKFVREFVMFLMVVIIMGIICLVILFIKVFFVIVDGWFGIRIFYVLDGNFLLFFIMDIVIFLGLLFLFCGFCFDMVGY